MPSRCRRVIATTRKFRSRALRSNASMRSRLTLTLLLRSFTALGLAVVLSEQFSRPLGLLAEGTRAVAQGDFSRRHPVQSRDELGVLTESFNTMTARLAQAQQKEEERPPRDRDDARLSRKRPRQSVDRRACIRQRVPPAHGQSECGRHSSAAARRPDRRSARRLGNAACPRSRPSRSWSRRALAPAATGSGSVQAEMSVSNHDARAPDARLGAAGRACAGVRGGVRRRLRARAGAARRGVGRGRAPPRARDQESADPDPAFGRAAGGQACRQARRRRRGGVDARYADHRCAGCRDETHGRRLCDLRAAAATGRNAAGRSQRPLARGARPVRESAAPCVAEAHRRPNRRPRRTDPPSPGVS